LQCILDNDIASTYNDIKSACLIFIKLLITVVTTEHSFSKLKIIKNSIILFYLRNSTPQDSLTNISILHNEIDHTNK